MKRNTMMDDTARERLLKKFKTVHYISSGSFASVWKVEHHDSLPPSAIKCQRYENKKEGTPGYILRELDVLSRISHPKLIKLFNISHSHEKNVDMELALYPQDLNRWISTKTWTERSRRAEGFFYDLLDALHTLHSNNVYHFDIKATNILVHGDSLVLSDLGLCSADNLDTFSSGTILCSTDYRPPELLVGGDVVNFNRVTEQLIKVSDELKKCYSESFKTRLEIRRMSMEKIDVWSAGCVMLTYILGRNPFMRGDNDRITFLAIVNEEEDLNPEDLKGLSVDWDVIGTISHGTINKTVWKTVRRIAPRWYPLLRSMLAINPEKRVTTSEAFELFCNLCDTNYSLSRCIKRYGPPRERFSNEARAEYRLMKDLCGQVKGESCFSIAKNLFHAYLNNGNPKHDPSLVAICCAYIAIKYKHYQYPSLDHLIQTHLYSSEAILELEPYILNTCKYRIGE
jgi:serine/threonine protein kinase